MHLQNSVNKKKKNSTNRSGSVLAAYISFGISASQLLSASVMAAPAALALAKLFYPETEKSQTKAGDIKVPKGSVHFSRDFTASI